MEGLPINIIGTGALFSGEVERILSTVDSVLLLVDAGEGPMPQTRYVLSHALRMGLKPIVYINKVDRKEADPVVALNATFDLFFELGATEEQADFPVLYGSGLAGWAVSDLSESEGGESKGMDIRFSKRSSGASASLADEGSLQNAGEHPRVERYRPDGLREDLRNSGREFLRMATRWEDISDKDVKVPVANRNVPEQSDFRHGGAERNEEASWGHRLDLGPRSASATPSSPELEGQALPPLDIEEPTVSMFFLVNNGPFSGQEGQAITLRQLKARLQREMHVNVALRMEDLGRPDGVKVSGRGELQLAILIEEMRREGMEFCVSKPEVITEEIGGVLYEPMEDLVVDIPEEYQGIVFEKLSRRKAG